MHNISKCIRFQRKRYRHYISMFGWLSLFELFWVFASGSTHFLHVGCRSDTALPEIERKRYEHTHTHNSPNNIKYLICFVCHKSATLDLFFHSSIFFFSLSDFCWWILWMVVLLLFFFVCLFYSWENIPYSVCCCHENWICNALFIGSNVLLEDILLLNHHHDFRILQT